MAVCRCKAFLVILSGDFVVLFYFEPDHTIDELRIGLIDQNLKDWTTVKGALEHLDFITLKVFSTDLLVWVIHATTLIALTVFNFVQALGAEAIVFYGLFYDVLKRL